MKAYNDLLTDEALNIFKENIINAAKDQSIQFVISAQQLKRNKFNLIKISLGNYSKDF